MAGRPVWPGIFPGARLSRAHKAKIIEAFDPSGTVKEARSMGFGAAVVGVDIKTDKGEILMGADIHFVIEHNDPEDGLGWVGVFWSDAPHSPSGYNHTAYDNNANISAEEQRRRMDDGVHPFGRLGRRDYKFFGRLAGVRRDGPDPNGVPPDASVMTQRVVARWEGDGHSHGHMSLREFVKRKILDDNTLAEAAKSKLQGGDPIAEYLGDCVDESNDITLDDNTRVVFFFDN
jgi:hypothetical protein